MLSLTRSCVSTVSWSAFIQILIFGICQPDALVVDFGERAHLIFFRRVGVGEKEWQRRVQTQC